MDSRRRSLLALAGIAVVPRSLQAQSKAPGKTPVVAVWGIFSGPDTPAKYIKWLEEGLAKHGYVAGRDVRIEYVFTPFESIGAMAEESKRVRARSPDVIFPYLPRAYLRDAVRTLGRSSPVAFMGYFEEDARELVGGDLRRPAANITGSAWPYAEWGEKRLELVRELLPKATRVAVITDAQRSSPRMGRFLATGERLGLKVIVFDVARHGARLPALSDASEKAGNRGLAATLAEMLNIRPEAFTAYGEFNATEKRTLLGKFELVHGIPCIGDSPQAEAVISYSMDPDDDQQRLVAIIARILRGTKPGDIPVDVTSRSLLTVDLKRAKAIGVEIPLGIVSRADRVIR